MEPGLQQEVSELVLQRAVVVRRVETEVRHPPAVIQVAAEAEEWQRMVPTVYITLLLLQHLLVTVVTGGKMATNLQLRVMMHTMLVEEREAVIMR